MARSIRMVRRRSRAAGLNCPASRHAAGAAALAALVVALSGALAHPAAQSGDWPCDIRSSERIVAVGDVHGAYDRFVAILRAAGVIDQRQRWVAGRTIFVQTGDVLDRGADSRKVVDLLRRLEREAERAGGRTYALLGNHEYMRVSGDWRYVSAGELNAFQNGRSADLRQKVFEQLTREAAARAKEQGSAFDAAAYREQLMRDVPLGAVDMRLAFEAAGEYGAWVRTRPVVARINGILFLHGGIDEATSALGCEGINNGVRAELMSLAAGRDRQASALATSETGPLWYRGLATEPEEKLATALTATLQRLASRAMVIGHTTVPGRIASRFGGRVVQIDTGMLDGEFYPGGVASALEIRGDTLTAIYVDRQERLATLPPAASSGQSFNGR